MTAFGVCKMFTFSVVKSVVFVFPHLGRDSVAEARARDSLKLTAHFSGSYHKRCKYSFVSRCNCISRLKIHSSKLLVTISVYAFLNNTRRACGNSPVDKLIKYYMAKSRELYGKQMRR